MTVTAGSDTDLTDDTVALSHSAASSDSNYQGITIAGLTVTVADNDDPPPPPPPGVRALVSNLYETPASTGTDFETVAQPFTTGNNPDGYVLTSVELRADDTTDGTRFRVQIVTLDGDGEPSALLYTLSNPASIDDGPLTFTAPESANLAADTSYAVQVVISSANGGPNPGATLDVTPSWNEDLALYGWSIANTRFKRSSDTDPWSSSFTRLVQMRIRGVFYSGPSSDATLAALTLEDASDNSPIALNESFAAGTTSYAAAVDDAVEMVTIDAETVDGGATLAFLDGSGAALADADANADGWQVRLGASATTIQVEVTAEDATTLTYTLAVIVNDNADATLRSLSLSGVPLSPAFSPEVPSYSANVAYTVSSTTVTAVPAQSGGAAVVKLDGATDADGTVDLAEGANAITVEVTAPNGTAMRTYTITVTRRMEGQLSADATLRSLSLSGVAFSPTFSAGVTSYTASVADTVSSTTVTAATSHSGATAVVKLNGALDTDGTVDLAEGANAITVEVTAEDGTSMQTYTITVTSGAVGPPVITGVGGGGGGGGGGGPSPSTVDFEWTVKHDIEELDAGHDKPSGMWSDGATLWLAENGDGADDAVYAYDLASGERVPEKEFELDEANRAPRGIWSDGERAWVSDSGRDSLFAYDLATGERLEERDIALAGGNSDVRGIWSDGQTMWVLDGRADALFAYDLASGELLAEYALASDNDDPHGLWSDGVTLWVSNHDPKHLFAYRLPARPEAPAAADAEAQDLERVAEEEFGELSGASNNSPRGIWAAGGVMYVADESDGRVYSYNMPDAIDARLATLTLSGVEIGEFDPGRTEYEGVPGEGVTQTTVEATTVQRRTAIAIDPPDADGNNANGHQVALEGVSEITVTVTSADGSRMKTYRVAFTQALAEIALDTGWNTFAWPGAGGVTIADALGGDGDLANDISAAVAALYGWDEATGAWLAFFPALADVPAVNTLATLDQGGAYWIALTEPVTWTVPALTTVAEAEVEATARASAFAGTVTDPDGEEVAEGLAVEAYVGDTRCNAGEPVATYRALDGGGEVTRYYASVAHADQLAGCAAAGGEVSFRVGDRAVVETGAWDNAVYPWQTLDLTLTRETATEETVTIDVAVWRRNEDPFNALADLYISTRAPGESWDTHDDDGALAMTLYTSPRSGAQNWYRSELTPVEVVLADGSTVTIDVAVWRNVGDPTSLYISTRVPGEGWITHDDDGALAMTLYTSPRSGAQNWYRSDLTPIEVAVQ